MSERGERRRRLFERVLDEFGDGLWHLTVGYARGDADRRDLHQDILVALWEALLRFEEKSTLRTFAYRIAHNRGLSFRSYEARRRHGSIEEQVLTQPQARHDEGAQTDQRKHQLEEAVRALTPMLRQPIMLHLDGFTNAAIAEIAGISKGNVAVRLTRARKAIHDTLRQRKDA